MIRTQLCERIGWTIMVKGCQKRMVVLKNIGSCFYEEAYFILKENAAEEQSCDSGDMIAEANRIIAENQLFPARQSLGAGRCAGWFFGGILCGGGVMTLLLLLL